MKQELAARGENYEQISRDGVKELYDDAGIELSDTELDREIMAQFAERYLFNDEAKIMQFVKENRNGASRVWTWIKNTLRHVTGRSEKTFLEKAEKLYAAAFKAAGNVQGTEDGAKYSLSNKKKPTYEELVAKKPIKIVNIMPGLKSGTYADMKKDALDIAVKEGWFDKPHPNDDTGSLIFLTQKSYTHAFSNLTFESGEDTIRCMAHIPEIIKEADLVSVDKPRDKTKIETNVYTFFGAAKGKNGTTPVKLTVKEFNFTSLEALPKNIRAYFEKSGIMENYDNLYDAHALEVIGIEGIKKEPDASVEVYGETPEARDTPDSEISIADLLALVKGDAEKYIPKPEVKTEFSLSAADSVRNALMKAQQEYFKDSKVMDIQGMLFSPWELDAQGYGGNSLSQAPATMSADDYMEQSMRTAAQERAERLRPKSRDEFKSTPAIEKIGVKVANSVGIYRLAPQLRAQNDAAKKTVAKQGVLLLWQITLIIIQWVLKFTPYQFRG